LSQFQNNEGQAREKYLMVLVNEAKSEQVGGAKSEHSARSMSTGDALPGKTAPDLAPFIDTL